MRKTFDLLKQTVKEWAEDKVPRLGAALAYYTMFSLAPLLIIAIAIAGFVFGEEAARGRVTEELGSLINEEAAAAVEELILNARRPGAGIAATIIGSVTLLLGASGVIGQLKDSMNTIWEVKPKPGRGILGLLKDRFLSLAMVLGIGFMLLASLLLTAGLDAVSEFAFGSQSLVPLMILNFVVSFAVITLLFAVIYKVLPDVKIAWRDVWVGAVVHCFSLQPGQVPDRPISRSLDHGLCFRGGRVLDRDPLVDLLLVTDSLLWRRVHPGLGQPLRGEARARRGGDCLDPNRSCPGGDTENQDGLDAACRCCERAAGVARDSGRGDIRPVQRQTPLLSSLKRSN